MTNSPIMHRQLCRHGLFLLKEVSVRERNPLVEIKGKLLSCDTQRLILACIGLIVAL